MPQDKKKNYLFGKVPAMKYTPLKKGKKKLAPGGFLKENSSGIGAAGNLAGGLIDTFAPETSMGGGIASGAIKGASSLAALGPYGMAAGAVIGGVTGAIGSKKAKEEEEFRNRQQQAVMQSNLMSNAGNYKHGGKLLSKQLQPVSRGILEPISDDAVEVKADKPQQSDSVELDNAFVDNNEVIDNQQRVFSDSLFTPSGKSIAKEAKRLEKQKAEDYQSRFADANKHIEGKLDELFNYQESMKTEQEKSKVSFKKGGKLVEFFTKPKLAKGGLEEQFPDLYKKPFSTTPGITPTGSPYFNPEKAKLDGKFAADRASFTSTGEESSTIDWNKGLTQAATFAPNIVNSVLQKKLKTSPAPVMETQTKLQRINPDAQLAQNNRDYRQAQGQVLANTGQSSDIISGTGSLLAKKFGANNQTYGQTNQINASIQGQEAAINQGVKARNTERSNQFRDSIGALSNKKLQMTSENVSNLSGKVLQQGAERNQIALDEKRAKIIGDAFGDSGVLKRLQEKDPETYNLLKNKGMFKKGGKLPLKLNIKKKK
jgi:hypothetical protein